MRADRQGHGIEYGIQGREELRQIQNEAGGQRRDRAAFGDPHLRPAIDETPKRTVGLPQERVFAAGLRQSGGQFRVAQSAGQREHAPHHPDRKNHFRGAGALNHGLRHQENAAANYRAHDDRGR